jgi:teichuronic acid biosynthesis glycosyltransferase TuaG
MPAFEAEQWIGSSIDSVIKQTFEEWELIIIDDGSTDQTAEICQLYTQRDPRIQYHYQLNGRQGKARNLGIKQAKGVYIAFLDADDLWVPEKLERSLDLLAASGADMISTGAWEWDGSSDLRDCRQKYLEETLYTRENALYPFALGNRIPLLTVVLRKDALDAVRGFDEDKKLASAEDYDLWIRLLLAGYRIQSIKEPLAIYRIHPSSSTHGDHLATLPASRVVLKNFQQGVLTDREWLQVRRRWIRRLGERWDKNEDKAVVLDLVQQFFPSHRIVSSLWSLRRIIGKKFHTRLMHSYCKWMAE